MDVIFPRGAGREVPKKSVTARRITPDPTGPQAEGLVALKECGPRTVDVLVRSEWLTEAGMTHGAIASTGASWKPGFPLREGSVPVVLGQAAHVKQGPGRKTEKAEARWLAKRRR